MPGLEALWDLPLWAVAGIGFVAFLVVLRIVSNLLAPRPLKLGGAHVVITGGSSGIGKAVAAVRWGPALPPGRGSCGAANWQGQW